MKFLIIAQDLRVSGTSEGMVSRSFISKLRSAYPSSLIDVVYLRFHASEDQLHLLPVDHIEDHVIDFKVPSYIRWANKLYWRFCHESLNERYIQKKYSEKLAKINDAKYDRVFIRSAGLAYEAVLAANNLPILKRAIINFHDPYPIFWCAGNNSTLDNLELFRLKAMHQVVLQANACTTPANTLTHDMQTLYGSKNTFYTLPHQYDKTVFDFSDRTHCFEKGKQLTICYQGAIQFGRNICSLLDAYKALLEKNSWYRENTEFVVRVKKTIDINYLSNRYSGEPNIRIMGPANFSESAFEQIHLADINIILENGPIYSNILVGKAPFLASINKPILSISPSKSELRTIIKDDKYIANCNDFEDIKSKLEGLITEVNEFNAPVYPFGDYFSDAHFKHLLDKVLIATKA